MKPFPTVNSLMAAVITEK